MAISHKGSFLARQPNLSNLRGPIPNQTKGGPPPCRRTAFLGACPVPVGLEPTRIALVSSSIEQPFEGLVLNWIDSH